MRILISGAGPAGLSLAYWLQHHGFTPVIIEKEPAIRRGGYGIDFLGTGYDVAKQMGIIELLQTQQIRVKHVAYINQNGAEVATLNTSLLSKITRGKYLALMRHTLEEALYTVVANSVEIRFNHSLKQVQQDANSVSVTFDNNQVETFDLLIGADGVHSNTRRLVFGPDNKFEHFQGYYVACYPLPDHYGIGDRRLHYTEPHRQTVAYSTEKAGEIIALYLYKSPDVGYVPHNQRLSRLQQQFAGMGWLTQQFLADAPNPKQIFMDKVAQVKMPQWHQGRVALVGDACGCMTQASGQGSSMALGGAYLLAKALYERRNHEDAFHYFEQRLRPAIEKRQQGAQRFSKVLLPRNQLELTMLTTIMNIVLRDPFANLLRQLMQTNSLLQEA